jgi:hypothetical protein
VEGASHATRELGAEQREGTQTVNATFGSSCSSVSGDLAGLLPHASVNVTERKQVLANAVVGRPVL